MVPVDMPFDSVFNVSLKQLAEDGGKISRSIVAASTSKTFTSSDATIIQRPSPHIWLEESDR